jgi:hypothetical protein
MPLPWEIDWQPAGAQAAQGSAPWERQWSEEEAPQPRRPFTLADTWPARIARSAWSAVTLPGDVATGKVAVPIGLRREDLTDIPGPTREEAGQQIFTPIAAQPLDPVAGRAAELAALAGPVNPAVRAGDQAVAGGARGFAPQAPSAQALRSAAERGYTSAREMGVEFPPQAMVDFGAGVQAALEKDGIVAALAPKTIGILRDLQRPPPGGVVTLTNVETVRRSLGHAAADFTNPTERLAASRAIEELDNGLAMMRQGQGARGPVEAAAAELDAARGNYAAASRSDKITGLEERAELNAAVANSGMNVDNAIRQRMRDIVVRPKEARGFSEAELAQIEGVARGAPTTNAARYIGNLLGGGGGLGAIVTGSAGALGGALAGSVTGAGPAAAAVGAAVPPAIGYTAKQIANALTRRDMARLDEAIRKRSPLYEAQAEGGGNVSMSPALRAALARALMLGAMPSE